jgi:hypothetical protein
MLGVKNEVVKGTNELIKEQQAEAAASGDPTYLTITTFDTKVVPVYIGEEISLVNPVSLKDTFLGGGTALLDAVGKTLVEAKTQAASRNTVVIYTDGRENASHEYDKDQIRDLIKELEDTGRWQFIFLGAEFEDFAEEAAVIGVTSTINTSKQNVTGTFRSISAAHSYTKTLSDQEYGQVTNSGGLLSASAKAGVDWEAVEEKE